MKLDGWPKHAIYGIQLLELPKQVENSTFGIFEQNFCIWYDV